MLEKSKNGFLKEECKSGLKDLEGKWKESCDEIYRGKCSRFRYTFPIL